MYQWLHILVVASFNGNVQKLDDIINKLSAFTTISDEKSIAVTLTGPIS